MNEVLKLVHKAKSKSKSFTKKIIFRVDFKETSVLQSSLTKIHCFKPNPEVMAFLAEVQARKTAF